MIGFPRRLIVEHVLDPQADPARGELRAFRDPDARPLDTNAQEIDLLATRTRPVSHEIGGGMTLSHEIDVAVAVQHGDPAEAVRLRDAIVLDLILRLRDADDAIRQETDAASGQYVTRIVWAVDWRPLTVDDTNETATITFTIDTQLDR